MSIELDARLRVVENKLDKLLTRRRGIPIVTDTVSAPPTDAELDAAFGDAFDLYNGFVGLLHDEGAETVWLCAVVANTWWYEQLTLAA